MLCPYLYEVYTMSSKYDKYIKIKLLEILYSFNIIKNQFVWTFLFLSLKNECYLLRSFEKFLLKLTKWNFSENERKIIKVG